MTAHFETPDESFEEFALPEDVSDASSPEPLRFAPWHKPRKQFVRRYQWLHHGRSLLDTLFRDGNLKAGEPMRYLTLPGPDLFDVKLFAQMCSEKGVRLQYTGFCYASETDSERLRRNIRHFEIDRAEQIYEGSSVNHSRLEDILKPKSEARTLLQRNGPYSIINIDACEPLAKKDANETGRLIDAIRSIVEYQLNVSRKPWSLYITTPVQTDSISKESLTALKAQIQQNLSNDQIFADEFSGISGGADFDQFFHLATDENGLDLSRIVALGIAKWLLHLAEQASYTTVKLPSYCYSMFRKPPFEPNMISTCFLFLPKAIAIDDNSGLTKNNAKSESHDGISNHVRALRKSFDMINLDEMMKEDQLKKQAMAAETKELLLGAGYNVDDPEAGYDVWLSKEPIEVNS